MSKVLIIDDDAQQREKFKKILRSNHIDTIEAPDAIEFTNCLLRDKSDIDLILLDIQMPVVDGRDVYELLEEHAPEIPVIVSSVLPVKDQRLKIPRARDYFNKAEKDEIFLDKVKRILGL